MLFHCKFFLWIKDKHIEIKFRYLKYDTNCCEIYTLYSNEKIMLRLIAGKKSTKNELFKEIIQFSCEIWYAVWNIHEMYHISLLNCRKMSGSRKLDNFEPSIVYIYENFLTASLVRGPYSYLRINIGTSEILDEITNRPLGRILT